MAQTLRLTPSNTISFCGSVFCIFQNTDDCCRHVFLWLLWDSRGSLMGYLSIKAGHGWVAEFVRCQSQLLPSNFAWECFTRKSFNVRQRGCVWCSLSGASSSFLQVSISFPLCGLAGMTMVRGCDASSKEKKLSSGKKSWLTRSVELLIWSLFSNDSIKKVGWNCVG